MSKANRTQAASSRLKLSASAVALLTVVGTGAAIAQNANEPMETVVVTGFRESLEKALDMKRAALGSTDSILAEDIAKFPDLNVSESLQRIPGVAITRDSGEGRQVTVRGLGSQFTRVRINGMEALTTVGGEDTNTSGGGTNRGRGFDFNVFASELFSQLTVHKTASADLQEGSLGATVDMHTGHPFDRPGFVFAASGEYGYQQYGGQSSPRVAALISDTFLGGRLGVLVSGAYAVSNLLEEGSDNGRWVSQFNAGTTVDSTWQLGAVNGATSGASGTDYYTANAAFRGRFPRYAIIPLHEKRLGLTGSVQWQPDEDTLFTLDGMFADFAQVRQEEYMEPYALSQAKVNATTKYPQQASTTGGTWCRFANETCATTTASVTQLYTQSAKLINYTAANIDANNNLNIADMTNVGLRSEHRLDHLDTRFMQLTLDGTHTFSETFKVNAMAGWSESHHRNPIQTTITADLGCVTASATACNSTALASAGGGSTATPFIYDYSSGKIPLVNMGLADATNATGWYLSQIRERAAYNYNSYRTATADFEWSPTQEVKVEGGVDLRFYGYNTADLRRSMGGNTNLDAVIPAPIQTAFLANQNAYAQVATLKAISTPTGATKSWWVPNLDAFNNSFGIWDQSATHYPFTNYYATGSCLASGATKDNTASLCGAFNMGITPNIGANGQVHEDDYGTWLQVGWDTAIPLPFLGDVPLRGNVGGRYILTETTSTGYTWNTGTQAVVAKTVSNTYHDFLPAFNAVLEPVQDFLVRFSANYAMSRPGLTSMLPTASASVSGSNWTYSIGNPRLQPIRSKNLDLGLEWYYHKGALLSVAGFWKHIDSFTQTASYNNTFAGMLADTTLIQGLTPAAFFSLTASDLSMFIGACGGSGSTWPTPATSTCSAGAATVWKFSTTINSKGAPLYGTEINWQQPLDFLPGPFDSFGVLGNVTFVQSQQLYNPGASQYMGDLIGLSRTSYNGTFYYDDTVFQARLTANFRSHYMIDAGINTLNKGTFSHNSLNIDASASYKYSENIMFTFNALNLTNQAMDIYVDSTAKRTDIYHKTGSVFYAGVRYTY